MGRSAVDGALVRHAGTRRLTPGPGTDQAAVYSQRSALHEVGLTLTWSPVAVNTRHDVGVELTTRLPATAQALAAGRISLGHAKAVAEVIAAVPADPASDAVVAAVDQLAADRGPVLTAGQTRHRCRRLLDRLDPDAATRRLAAAHAGRRAEKWADPAGDGCLALRGDPRDVQAMWDQLTTLAGPREAGDPRTLDNRRFDAALATLLGETEAGSPDPAAGPVPRVQPRAQVQVIVDLATLAGLADHPGELVGYGPIPADITRAWCFDATSWRRLVTDPVTGHLLDYGPHRRFAPPRLQQFLAARDQHCTFPGCTQPAARCQADHQPPWQPDGTGGSTSAADQAMICQQHHLWKTHYGWNLQRAPDGTSIWTSPTGRTYRVTRPPALE